LDYSVVVGLDYYTAELSAAAVVVAVYNHIRRL
jgi:hypothetical protein